jgi:formylmethanofuran dehydrogenase subunit B
MSGLPHGNARQHDSVPNWLAGFFEDVVFSDGSGQARAEAEGERVKKTERDADLLKASKIPWGLPADIVACLPAHKT